MLVPPHARALCWFSACPRGLTSGLEACRGQAESGFPAPPLVLAGHLSHHRRLPIGLRSPLLPAPPFPRVAAWEQLTEVGATDIPASSWLGIPPRGRLAESLEGISTGEEQPRCLPPLFFGTELRGGSLALAFGLHLSSGLKGVCGWESSGLAFCFPHCHPGSGGWELLRAGGSGFGDVGVVRAGWAEVSGPSQLVEEEAPAGLAEASGVCVGGGGGGERWLLCTQLRTWLDGSPPRPLGGSL